MELNTQIKLSKEDIYNIWYWAIEYHARIDELMKDYPENTIETNMFRDKATIELNRLVNNAFKEGMEFQKKMQNDSK